MRRALLLVVLPTSIAPACDPPARTRGSAPAEPDASGSPSPDGVPVDLGPSDELLTALAVDADGDGDRDLYAVVRSVASPHRLVLLPREGETYGPPRPVVADVLDELPEGAVERGSIELGPQEPGLFHLSYRYLASCAPAEREEVAVRTIFPLQGAEQPAMSWNAHYRRLPCGRADQEYLQVCRPPPFVDRRITGRLEDGGERLILEVTTPGGSTAPVELRRAGARYRLDPERLEDLVETARREAEAAAARPPEEALAAAERAIEIVDVACPSAGVEMPCFGASLGIPAGLGTACGAERGAPRSALLVLAARALARMGRARAALERLARARESSRDTAGFARAEREILARVAPAAARPVGIVVEARPPDGDLAAIPSPFVWEGPDSLLYTLGGDDLGRLIVGQGDRGKVKGLEAREVRRLRAPERRSPSDAHVLAGADLFGVFVCPTAEAERRACQEAVRAARRDEEEAPCELAEDLPATTATTATTAAIRLGLGRCAGATSPAALGFLDDDRVALVGAGSPDPIAVSIADPTRREPLAAVPSTLLAGSSFAADGSFRLVSTDLGVFRIDRATGRELRVLAPGFDPEAITVSPDGKHFAAFVSTGGARVFELPR